MKKHSNIYTSCISKPFLLHNYLKGIHPKSLYHTYYINPSNRVAIFVMSCMMCVVCAYVHMCMCVCAYVCVHMCVCMYVQYIFLCEY